MAMDNAIGWFEIPAIDLERATAFYQTILGINLAPMDLDNIRMRMFPLKDPRNGVRGALVDSGGFHRPSVTEGRLIYLNGDPDLQTTLDKVHSGRGSIMVPRTAISAE